MSRWTMDSDFSPASASVSRTLAPQLDRVQRLPRGSAEQTDGGAAARYGVDFSALPLTPASAGQLQRKCQDCAEEESAKVQRSPTEGAPEKKDDEEKKAAGVQTALTVGPVGDRYELEAEQMADHVMSSSPSAAPGVGAPTRVQREENKKEEEESAAPSSGAPAGVQRAEDKKEEEEPAVQRAPQSGSGGVPRVTPSLSSRIQRMRGSGQPLREADRSFFEPRFGADFSRVRLHADPQAADTASSLSARAFTVGPDIAFAAGQYAPDSDSGRRLLAHELTHVVQQGHASARK